MSRKTYELADNALGVRSLSFMFEGDGVRVTFACGVGNTTFEQDARPVLTGRIAP